MTNIVIPKSVTNIDIGAFYNCTSLTSIVIPNSITSINDYTFQNCTNLTSVTVPESVTSIGTQAFYDCDSLETIVLPSVASMSIDTFYGLKNLVLMANTVCALNQNITKEFIASSIYVPDTLVDSYKASENWSAYASRIKPISQYVGSVGEVGS